MLALISAEAEKVPFTTPLLAEGPVESWLLAMQHNMCSTLYDNCKACLIQTRSPFKSLVGMNLTGVPALAAWSTERPRPS